MTEVSDQEHNEHHLFLREVVEELREFLAERKREREKWDKIKSTALFTMVGLITTAAFGFFIWLGKLVLHYIHYNPPAP